MPRETNIQMLIEENRNAKTFDQVLQSAKALFPFKCTATINDYASTAWKIIMRERNAKD